MKSSAGEVVKLSALVKITEEVEVWLRDLMNEMKQSLAILLKTTLNIPNLDIVSTPSHFADYMRWFILVTTPLKQLRKQSWVITK